MENEEISVSGELENGVKLEQGNSTQKKWRIPLLILSGVIVVIVFGAIVLVKNYFPSEPKIGDNEIRFNSPKNGTIITPGQEIQVIVEIGKNIEGKENKLVLVGKDIMQEGTISTTNKRLARFTITVPKTAIGSFDLLVVGKNKNKDLTTAEISLPVHISNDIVSIEFEQSEMMLFGTDYPQAIYLKGKYSDGISRDIRESKFGTTYETSDPQVVTVTADGKVEAHNNGSAHITVRNGSVEANLSVTVKIEDGVDLEMADVTYPKTVRAGERFTYVVTIRNKSAFRALNAFVHFGFSGALYIENATGIGWSCDNGIIYSKDATKICRRDFIPAGETTTVSIELDAPTTLGEFENNIYLDSDDLHDPSVDNNYLATKIIVQ